MFSTTTEYALRALALMAQLPEDEAVLGRDLAERADIPANYLSKILWTLGGAKIIDATRGSRGGYRLHRKATEIHLAEVVELFDKGKAKPSCLLVGGEVCSDLNPCSAHHLWRDVRMAYCNFLESTTIADISRPAQPANNGEGGGQ